MEENVASPTEASVSTDSRNGDLESKLLTYKHKLKILKKAFIEEQSEKEAYKKQLVSSYNNINKLQTDLDEKEQKYLKWYKENQELHDSLINARSAGGRAASFSMKPGDFAEFQSNSGSDKQSHKNGNNDSEVLQLKLNQLESKIKELDNDNEKLEQELYEKKSEIMEMKTRTKEESSELKSKIRDLEYQNEILTGEREENERKVEQRIAEIEAEKQKFTKELEDKLVLEIDKIKTEVEEEKTKLKQQIKDLEGEGNKRTDEFLKFGVEMDKLKDDLTVSLEKEVKLRNENDWLQEMNNTMQTILHKHESENRQLAEQLVAFKQQIIESDSFNTSNRKFEGQRWTSFGKSNAILYFAEESKGDNKVEVEYYLIMEYGAGKAFKVNLESLKEFYVVQDTFQLCFTWPEKNFFKKTRTETFETMEVEEILDKYLELEAKINDETYSSPSK